VADHQQGWQIRILVHHPGEYIVVVDDVVVDLAFSSTKTYSFWATYSLTYEHFWHHLQSYHSLHVIDYDYSHENRLWEKLSSFFDAVSQTSISPSDPLFSFYPSTSSSPTSSIVSSLEHNTQGNL
jgi:hypothetical protein